METILNISEAASLGMHAVAFLAGTGDESSSTRQIAEAFSVSEHHLAKVLQRLSRAGLVRSIRGPKGGFVLARGADEITLLDVYRAIDGPIPGGECLLGSNVCRGEACILGDLLAKVNAEVMTYLADTRVSQLKSAIENGAGVECGSASACGQCKEVEERT